MSLTQVRLDCKCCAQRLIVSPTQVQYQIFFSEASGGSGQLAWDDTERHKKLIRVFKHACLASEADNRGVIQGALEILRTQEASQGDTAGKDTIFKRNKAASIFLRLWHLHQRARERFPAVKWLRMAVMHPISDAIVAGEYDLHTTLFDGSLFVRALLAYVSERAASQSRQWNSAACRLRTADMHWDFWCCLYLYLQHYVTGVHDQVDLLLSDHVDPFMVFTIM